MTRFFIISDDATNSELELLKNIIDDQAINDWDVYIGTTKFKTKIVDRNIYDELDKKVEKSNEDNK